MKFDAFIRRKYWRVIFSKEKGAEFREKPLDAERNEPKTQVKRSKKSLEPPSPRRRIPVSQLPLMRAAPLLNRKEYTERDSRIGFGWRESFRDLTIVSCPILAIWDNLTIVKSRCFGAAENRFLKLFRYTFGLLKLSML